MSYRGYMVGTYGCRQADAAANFRMQNPHRSIGMSDRAAAAALDGNGGCPSPSAAPKATSGDKTDPATGEALARAAETGQGVTRPELKGIVSEAITRQGDAATLPPSTRQAIKQAVEQGSFARKSTAQLALQLSQGKIAPADIGARLGRAQ